MTLDCAGRKGSIADALLTGRVMYDVVLDWMVVNGTTETAVLAWGVEVWGVGCEEVWGVGCEEVWGVGCEEVSGGGAAGS